MPLALVPAVESLIEAALTEDLGDAGDLTSRYFIDGKERSEGVISAREPGVVAGLEVAARVFEMVDPEIGIEIAMADGQNLMPGDVAM